MRTTVVRNASLYLIASAVAACGGNEALTSEDDFTSNQATLFDFTFDGELIASPGDDAQDAVNEQLLYTIGQLNGDLRGVGRLDKVKITNTISTPLANGKTKVTYHAVLPVGVGATSEVPRAYSFILPRDVSRYATGTLTRKYTRQTDQDRNIRCAAWEGHELSGDNFWYYYRPNQPQCTFEESDVIRIPVAAARSTENTADKYPEYDRIWEDNTLSVVAIYGRYDDGSTGLSDPNIAAYAIFHDKMAYAVGMAPLNAPPSVDAPKWAFSVLDTSNPAELKLKAAAVPPAPDDRFPYITREGTMKDGRKVRVDAMLVDGASLRASRGQTGYNSVFDAWYNQRSKEADLIVYTGHAGLGSNVRALTKKGEIAKGKYQILFMDGCDTFAYVDGYLGKKKAEINPDDPNGTKYLDIMTTLTPTVPSWTPQAFVALITGLTQTKPATYQQIFRTFADKDHVVVVTGEEDNTFAPRP